MVRIGAPYKNKLELDSLATSGDIGDDFLVPLFNPSKRQEFTASFSNVRANIANAVGGDSSIAFEDVVFVSANGNDNNDGTRITAPKQSIQSAVGATKEAEPMSMCKGFTQQNKQ